MRGAQALIVVSLGVPLILMPSGLFGCLPSAEDGTGRPIFAVPPNVVLTADVLRGIVPLTVRFSSTGSTDDGLIVSRAWNFGDGGTSADISPTHTFLSTGEFTVTLTLTDDDGFSASDSIVISVTEAPVPVIKVDRTWAESPPAQFEFDASSSYDPDGTITTYRWVFGDGPVEYLPVTVHTFATAGTYRVKLTVTDDTGVAASTSKIIQVGIPQPEIELRVPPSDLQNVVVSRESPLWIYAVYEVEPGVPRTVIAGLQPIGEPTSSSIQLDTDPPNGNDLNLTIPVALDLSVLTDAQVPGQYYLWAELQTDQTLPVRAYATPRINVVESFTSTADVSTTPRIPLVNDRAVVVIPPTPTRHVFDLGPLNAGDRLHLSLASMPGYGEFYDADVFSVMVLDAEEKLFAWYQDGFALLSPDAKLVIGHTSSNYYVVVDGCPTARCGRNYLAHSVSVRVEREVGLVPRAQRIYLNFNGGQNISVGGVGPQDIDEFDASDLNPAWGAPETAAIKAKIQERLEELFAGYGVSVFTSRPAVPFQTIYFGGAFPSWGLYAASDYVDPRNNTLAGTVLVATEALASAFPGYSADQMGAAIGNIAGHYAGYLLGLRNTEGGAGDVMDPDWLAGSPHSESAEFMAAPLSRIEQYNYDPDLDSGQIGTQDVPELFEEIIGTTD